MKFTKTPLAIGISAALFASQAMATNGYFRVGYSANSIAMGGAVTAQAQDAIGSTYNPALALSIDTHYTVAASFFAPEREFTVSGGNPATAMPGEFALTEQNTSSDSPYFVIPSFGYNRKLSEDLALNMSLYANGGMNTDYSESVFYAGETGVDLSQIFLSTALAYKLSDATHFGIAPIFALQRFKAKGLSSFAPFSSDASKLTDNEYDYSKGIGARFGLWQRIDQNWSLGASYQSEVHFEKFEEYEGLFEGHGRFNIPETYNIGVAFERSNYTVALDYQRINYSDIASVGNPLLPALQTTQLGRSGAAGFGWEDMHIAKLGLAMRTSETETVRFGISYAEQPIPSSEVLFNILAPGVQEWHFTAGYELAVDDVDYSFALMYSPSKKVEGRNPLLQSQEQTITLEMSQIELTFGANF